MPVKLRLMRTGKRNRAFYRVCVVDARRPRGGAYIESIGHYDPLVADDNKKVTINTERAQYWLSQGAQPTETVWSFLAKLRVPGLVKPKRPRKRREWSPEARARSAKAWAAKASAAKSGAARKRKRKSKKEGDKKAGSS